MKFLLVNLDWPGLVSKKTYKIHLSLPPLDLILLANAARNLGHQAQIYDCFVEASNDMSAELATLSRSVDWVIIATTPYHMWQCPNSEWEWIRTAIASFPKDKVVLTGIHASVFPEKTLRETGVHAVIRSEPEATFSAFLAHPNWHDIPGTSFVADNAYQASPNIPPPTMDQLVVQDYCVDISKYGYFLLGKKSGVFEASRGCPWKCTFCDQEMYNWTYRTKSPELFAEEVIQSVKQTGMRTAYFYDLEFTVSKKRTLALCQELMKVGVPNRLTWCCQTRADTVDEEVLEALKASGCRLIHFGVESANKEILKATNKKITLEKIDRGVRLAKKKGLETACFFMFGLPDETPDQFDNTLDFARSLNPTYASFHFAIPFPGTPLYDEYLKRTGLERGAWPATFFNGWTHEQISAYIRNSYRKFYLFPKRFEPKEFACRLRNLRLKLKYFLSL